MSQTLLTLEDVEVHFNQSTDILASLRNAFGDGPDVIRAVDGVDIELRENEVQGIIGESGCGKTTLLKTMVNLQEPTGGEVYFKGDPLSVFDDKWMRRFRRNVQIIFQDPFDSLDPKFTVEDTLEEQLDIHGLDNRDERKREILRQVHLEPAERYLDKYPRELSGGEKQRVSIARALIVDPDVILADEPVSMLDVSTQASILNLLSNIVESYDLSIAYISHDLSTVSYICDTINVMYLGRIVESAPTMQILEEPKHPYTQALIQSIPLPDPYANRQRVNLDGEIPDPKDIPSGCRFKDRCPERMEACDRMPPVESVDANHHVACHLHTESDE